MIWRGWIGGAPREEFEECGIVITGYNEDGNYTCTMTDEVFRSIEDMWGEWYWGLSTDGEEDEPN